MKVIAFTALALPLVTGHGQMVIPASNRHKATVEEGGGCDNQFSCVWFSQPTTIPDSVEPLLNEEKYRTYNVKVSSGPGDWSAKMPWRAPGRAPVLGSGCGVAGGNSTESESTAGFTPPGIPQGMDGVKLPAMKETVWKAGSVQEVAFGLLANHGGGYSYRLCPLYVEGGVSEACFQKTVLTFSGDKQLLRWADIYQPYPAGIATHIPDYEIPLVVWTDPENGAEWARNPVPGCNLCNQGTECMNNTKGLTPDEVSYCSQSCSGMNMTHCPPGLTQFPEPLHGISGFDIYYGTGWQGFPWSIVDFVNVPATLEPGKYLLSWRWDCEQSNQIWQNCADIVIE